MTTIAAPFVSDTPHRSANIYGVSSSSTTMTPSLFNSAFVSELQQEQQHQQPKCYSGGRIQHPLRKKNLRTPPQLRLTVTPMRVMGINKSPLDGGDSNLQQTTEAVDTAQWTKESTISHSNTSTTECDEYEDGPESPLLKASQESAGGRLDHLRSLTVLDDVVDRDSGYTTVQGTSIPLSRLRQMRQRDDYSSETTINSCSFKKPRLQSECQQMGGESVCTFPDSADTTPAKNTLGEQIVDAASILMSIGQGRGSVTSSHQVGARHSWQVVKEEEKDFEDESSEDERHDDEDDDTYSDATTSPSPCNDYHQHSPKGLPAYSEDIRLFPSTIPIDTKEFPRLYQRYKVPSSISEKDRLVVYGAEAAHCVKDKDLRAIAIRGMRELGSWNEPTDALDLYTPRWVRGALKEKLGLCTICYEEEPGKMVWKRTKTSEYNYHLINQHGISPQTHRPYDPPIAFQLREQASTSVGHRKIIIQGKCHACKKYIDMQGKYTGKVNVPEIYWWKHARKCHKGKKGLAGADGVFVEDTFYHRVVANMKN